MESEILKDLIRINNDRIAGYRKSLDQLGSGQDDLRAVFSDMIQESEQHVAELSREAGENPVEDTTTGGKLYRAWSELRGLFSGKDRNSILESCESTEDAALKAYEDALGPEGDMTNRTRNVIVVQQIALKGALEKIKALRLRERNTG
ncbi:MAG TPA: PA2169 family four-helix-bundle protein [Sphingobacteriaceae bacterium]